MDTKAPNFDLEFNEATSSDQPEAAKPTQSEPDIPEKFKGKSVFDMIDMYQNAERKISEQGAQLGELRKLTDEVLELKKENAKPVERLKVTTEDLLTDPDSVLNKVIDSSPIADKLSKTESRLDAIEKSFGQREFESRHPNFVDDVQNPDFQKWVMANKARSGLMVELNNNYNFEAGAALWDMWEEHKQLSGKQNDNARRETIKQASTVRNSPSESGRKPVYSRAKLLELQAKAIRGDRVAQTKWNDPAFQEEYQAAYREGRVK